MISPRSIQKGHSSTSAYQKAALKPATRPIWFITTKKPLFFAGVISLVKPKCQRDFLHIDQCRKPLIHGNGCRYQGRPEPRNDSSDDQHSKAVMPARPCQQRCPKAHYDRSDKDSPSSSEAIARRACDENVACPRSQVVYGGDETLLGRIWMVKLLDEPGIDINGC